MKKLRQWLASHTPSPIIRLYLAFKRELRSRPKDEFVYFDPRTVFNGHHRVTYRGIKAVKCPFDYVMYQMLIFEIRPDLIIDIGTNTGGGTLYMADLLDMIGHGMIHTIDLTQQADPIITAHPRIKIFTGGWENYNIRNADAFQKIMVIEDGSHQYESSLGALKKFSPLVSIGSYYIVEDSIVSELSVEQHYNGGPLRAIREFLASTDAFEIDRKYCDMFGRNATFNVNGYLKRIK